MIFGIGMGKPGGVGFEGRSPDGGAESELSETLH